LRRKYEIKGLIKDSVVRLEEGSRLVNESGSTLEKVTEAVQQMDVAVQQNSALVEETSGLG
jgi:methyl-accepting chemotaxis protein